MKIAIIGPGLMTIPPNGWGAIESLIWKIRNQLTELGHEVVIFNSRNLKKIAKEINKSNFDFIHLQFDDHINFFQRNLKMPFCVTMHNGYFLCPDKWKPSYYSIISDSLAAPGIIALSNEIKNYYFKQGYNGFIRVLRNGTKVSDFSFKSHGNGKAICLGKIEPRKRQAILARELDGKINIDFVGPICDKNFKEGKTTKHLGNWTRDQVYQQLTNYSCLILASESEASPLVTVEGLSSGLSLLVTEASNANLPEVEFINVIPNSLENFQEINIKISKLINENNKYRKIARFTAENLFDEKQIIKDYLKIIDEFKLYTNSSRYKSSKVLKKNVKIKNIKYFFAKLYFLCNHFRFLWPFKYKKI